MWTAAGASGRSPPAELLRAPPQRPTRRAWRSRPCFTSTTSAAWASTSRLIAAAGGIGLAFCNSGPPGGRVVPHGGRRAALATNPLAYAVPAGSRPPIVADFSTSAAAEGRVRLARQNRLEVPDGWLVDAEGRPTRDPEALYQGGALLPAGGHRGYALALLVEILGGVLAGAGTSSTGDAPGNGLLLVALDPARWGGAEAFLAGVDAVADAVTAVDPAPEFDRVRLPGEPEAETEARRRAEGIPVPEATWEELAASRLALASGWLTSDLRSDTLPGSSQARRRGIESEGLGWQRAPAQA